MAKASEPSFTERCFACGRPIRTKAPFTADTREDQKVFVGSECYRLIQLAGEAGYQPPKGGPRLFPVNDQDQRSKDMKVWNISRNGQFAGSVRAKTAEQAVNEYAAWAHCDASELSAERA